MQRRTRLVVIGGTVALVAVGAVWWRSLASGIVVETAPVTAAVVEELLREEGRSRAPWHVDLTAPVSGEWRPADLTVGDTVAAGEALGVMQAAPNDPATAAQLRERAGSLEATLRAARALESAAAGAATEATRARTRTERLAPSGGVSQEQLDQVRLADEAAARALDAARAQVVAARHELAAIQALLATADRGLTLTAPATAVVLRRDEEHPRVVPAGTPLLMIGGVGTPSITVNVLSADAPRVRPGMPMRVSVGRDTLEGHVVRVEPAAQTLRSPLGVEEQRVAVIGDVHGPAPALGHEYQVDVQLVLAQQAYDQTVPVGALWRDGGRWMVFVVEDGRARAREVTVLAQGSVRAAISGLASAAQVVVHPPEALDDGARVRR